MNDIRILMELMCKALSRNKSVGELRAEGIKELGKLSVVDENGDMLAPGVIARSRVLTGSESTRTLYRSTSSDSF